MFKLFSLVIWAVLLGLLSWGVYVLFMMGGVYIALAGALALVGIFMGRNVVVNLGNM